MLSFQPCSGGHFWVFGYGSLIWDPGFAPVETRPGLLVGYHRRFCIYSHRYRGTADQPGLVLGLDRGGSCRGVALRVPVERLDEVKAQLWEREMDQYPVYHPRILPVRTEPGIIPCLAFVVDRTHRQYAGRLAVAEAAALIAAAAGDRGPCIEYLDNTVRHLDALGIGDQALRRLRDQVQRIVAA